MPSSLSAVPSSSTASHTPNRIPPTAPTPNRERSDSLSSAGASTDPLPASERDAPDEDDDDVEMNGVSKSGGPGGGGRGGRGGGGSRKKELAGGAESDSSLTEQSSSGSEKGKNDDGQEEEEEEDEGDQVRGGGMKVSRKKGRDKGKEKRKGKGKETEKDNPAVFPDDASELSELQDDDEEEEEGRAEEDQRRKLDREGDEEEDEEEDEDAEDESETPHAVRVGGGGSAKKAGRLQHSDSDDSGSEYGSAAAAGGVSSSHNRARPLPAPSSTATSAAPLPSTTDNSAGTTIAPSPSPSLSDLEDEDAEEEEDEEDDEPEEEEEDEGDHEFSSQHRRRKDREESPAFVMNRGPRADARIAANLKRKRGRGRGRGGRNRTRGSFTIPVTMSRSREEERDESEAEESALGEEREREEGGGDDAEEEEEEVEEGKGKEKEKEQEKRVQVPIVTAPMPGKRGRGRGRGRGGGLGRPPPSGRPRGFQKKVAVVADSVQSSRSSSSSEALANVDSSTVVSASNKRQRSPSLADSLLNDRTSLAAPRSNSSFQDSTKLNNNLHAEDSMDLDTEPDSGVAGSGMHLGGTARLMLEDKPGNESEGTGRGEDEEEDEDAEERGDEEEEEERERERERKSHVAVSKKKGKGRNGKGKAVVRVVEEENDNENQSNQGDLEDGAEGYGGETPVGSDHEEDTSDDAFVRKRAEAMEALTRIEIEFARLRDKLYLERMAEIEKERVGIENSTHPELIHLTRLIELRRGTKLDLAKRWLEGLEGAYERRRESDIHTVWNWWSDGRAELRRTMLDEANSKRRKLEREKRTLDRPKDEGIKERLLPRPLPIVPIQHRRNIGFVQEPLPENELAWSLRHKDPRIDTSVLELDGESVMKDLAGMGLRPPILNGTGNQEPLRNTWESPYGANAPFGYVDQPQRGGGHLVPGLGYPAPNDLGGLAQHPHHFNGSSLPPLPPLPLSREYAPPTHSRELNPSLPLSNNSRAPPINYSSSAKDAALTHQHSRPGQQQQQQHQQHSRGYALYPQSSYADIEAERHHSQAAWSQKLTPSQALPAHVPFDDGRWSNAAPSIVGAGQGQLGEAAIIGGGGDHHPSRRSNEDAGKSSESTKARFTLDGHMATTSSPKGPAMPAPPPLPPHNSKVTSNGVAGPAYMAIPAFNPRSRQSQPAPPLPPHQAQSHLPPYPNPSLSSSGPAVQQHAPTIQMSKASLVIPPHIPRVATPSPATASPTTPTSITLAGAPPVVNNPAFSQFGGISSERPGPVQPIVPTPEAPQRVGV